MGGTLGVQASCCCDEQTNDSLMEISAQVPGGTKPMKVVDDLTELAPEMTTKSGDEDVEFGAASQSKPPETCPEENATTAPLEAMKLKEMGTDSSTFHVEIDRGTMKLGMNVAVFDLHGDIKGVTVKAIREGGTVSLWNQAHPELMVCVGQQILKANDKEVEQMTVEELGNLFETATNLTLLIKRDALEKH
mmetsp:Transcript_12383/g.29114  ORF Transcript_12383/g.29114 Transcript_12383/m.29114 type:complete len:191 (+) Transcript_12383:58-630(+)